MLGQSAPASFGEWLRRQRKLHDLTQAELAKRVGCARITIRKFEAGDLRPSKQMAELLAQALGVPAGELGDFVRFARGAAVPAEPLATSVSAPRPPNNLPLQPTSFIGREHELADVMRLLAEPSPGSDLQRGRLEAVRLLTLTGSGGTGKTRLALHVATELLDGTAGGPVPDFRPGFADGVWLVELAPIADAALVPAAIAAVLGVREEPGHPILATLLESLRPKELLLILDNCEHLVDACANFADGVLRGCPDVRILATSREALGVPGETVYTVPPLACPNPAAADSNAGASLQDYAAVRLFIDRAGQAQAAFAPSGAELDAIAQICCRLDGIPLAIELAAARVQSMRVEQIAERLDDRFHLLTAGSRTALPRQQTLRALVDWSYSLLSEPELILFRRLTVFVGGWTLEAAEAVTSGNLPFAPDNLPLADILDLLSHLVRKSLVMLDVQASEPRYRMLETIRQYAREKLLESGESTQVHAAHLAAMLQFAEAAEPHLFGPDQAQWLQRLESDHDNLRRALAWALAQGEQLAALRLSGALHEFWLARGYWGEGRQWLQQTLALSGAAAERTMSPAYTAAYAKVLNAAGSLASRQGDYAAARELLHESLALRRELGDRQAIAATLKNLGSVARTQADYGSARALLEESLALSRDASDKQGMADALQSLGILARNQGDDAAQSLLTEALGLSREIGDTRGTTAALQNLGTAAQSQGDDAAARPLLEESLSLSRAAGDKQFIGLNLASLADIAVDQGDLRAARSLLAECLVLCQESGYRFLLSRCFITCAAVAQAEGHPRHATRMLGAAEALLERIGARSDTFVRMRSEQTAAAAHAQLDWVAFDIAWQEGRAFGTEQAIAEALRADPDELPRSPGTRAPIGHRPRGAKVLPPDEANAVPGTSVPIDLSPRERKVLSLMAKGLGDAQVAKKLAVSPRTVAAHLTTIYRKLGVHSRTAATRYALDHKLV